MQLLHYWILLATFVNTSGNIFTPEAEDAVIAFVESTLKCRNITGLSLSVVKGNETWLRGFGVADISTGRRVDSYTLFVIGSLGKAFTMTLLGTLLSEFSNSWNTKLSEIKSLNLLFGEEELTRNVTLDDLLAHKTGLSAITDFGFIGGYPRITDMAFLSKRLQYLPKKSIFRSSFVYNNLMYVLLGYITEIVRKESWETIIMSRVLKPIGMKTSKLLQNSADILTKDVAKPYIIKNEKIQLGTSEIYNIHPLEPAGGIMSNANDMAKWMRFNLNFGVTESGKRLVDYDEFVAAFQKHNEIPVYMYTQKQPTFPVDDITNGYGYAWFTSSYRGFKRYWHSGGLFSYISLLWLFPDQNIGVFINANGPGMPMSPGNGLKAIMSYISDILLNQTSWLNQDTACTFPSPWKNYSQFNIIVPTFSNVHLNDFVGQYGNELLPDITISVRASNSGENYLWFEMNRIQGELLPSADTNKFSFKMVYPWEYAIEQISYNVTLTYPVEFQRAADAYVTSFELKFSNTEIMKYRKGVTFVNAVVTAGSTVTLSTYPHTFVTLGMLIYLVHQTI